MRLFIAIRLPENIRKEISLLQLRLGKTARRVKWVAPENIHLTLKFIGEAQEEQVENITRAMAEAVKGINPFVISLAALGAFPSLREARVIWVGINKGREESEKIAQRLQVSLKNIAPQDDKPFKSHITIGRVKSGRSMRPKGRGWDAVEVSESSPLQEGLSIEKKEFNAEKITLFKSTLTHQGSSYEIIKEIFLKILR
ncbi:MAG: RNA 2',3'-cyclic phosphodiesterase [Candidatus Omnitrophica bacterium]|nr:RNA 2',3'-cyclic phosphodiesterase [Candidatus Omnitrophota bacterium]MBU4418915.1 RNA 2',3'-cyclic phosphodiesterase [Candidatus Omnitrophota bacterium]MBU4467920.1 RNA 2',3'-cyclic phosphodiesterase [Candidatus Omnitrophota bacterium]MCG2713393.1 RNA 2',3'-cyclic phosphodiesterase [Candidatus Omnitrophota bacterium]